MLSYSAPVASLTCALSVNEIDAIIPCTMTYVNPPRDGSCFIQAYKPPANRHDFIEEMIDSEGRNDQASPEVSRCSRYAMFENSFQLFFASKVGCLPPVVRPKLQHDLGW